MKKEIVKLETAILAKEKGFDYLCLAFYDDDELDNQDGNTLTDYNSDYWNRKNNHTHDILENQWFSAPTQSLLQKWLRDEHEINVFIYAYGFGYYPIHENIPPGSSKVKYIDRRWNRQNKLSLNFRTYEEALEKGLYEALKLI